MAQQTSNTSKDAQADTSNASASAPAIALPKGGGAIRGIGEKFAANPVTGTGSTSVPIATSPGRSGFGPQLSLSYDSGAGNGPFGFGWSLSLPSITRKTDKGLPQYFDAEDSDVFLLSGAEDLVPVLTQDDQGHWTLQDSPSPDGHYLIRRYRPRIEGLFARIERWTRQSDGDVHWRSLSKDNILILYGKDQHSRIYDPDNAHHIFTWLICETRDDKGNAVLYEYKPEDGAGVVLSQAHERNRGDSDDPHRAANRYLKHIRYGNRVPLLDDAGQRPLILTTAQIQNAGWMFEVIFDYDEGHVFNETTNGDQQTFIEASTASTKDWACRDDPFSSYRAGFELRTYRLCQRVLMFHHFDGEPGVGDNCLVRSTDFTYSHEQDPDDVRNPVYTFLLSVTQSGYKRNNRGYLKRSLPPVEYQYTQPIVQDAVQDVDAKSLENLPIGVDGAAYQWIDLHGEGIPGILAEQADAWFYKRNISPIGERPVERNISPIGERPVEFAPLELVAAKPNLALAAGAQFMDLASDGQPDLVVFDGSMPGLYEHDGDQGWQPFRPFTARVNRDMRDPNMKFVDLDGDGHADVLITEDDALVWHASLAEEGFGPARRVAQALDEEHGPRLVFADGTQSIYLADMSGDGLTDLVRICNGEVCYWPNLGYGRFGAKVTMDRAPNFDTPDQFDYQRIRLADIDGSGTSDIVYLHRDGVRLYFNQSGNSWSAPQQLNVFPRVDDVVSIVLTDLLGNGTACLVWSSPLPGDARHQMRYVDLMGGQKPHLLFKTINNLGAETHVHYAPSTKFYLEDKRDGKPWITKLPFPVHVVEKVETYDHISRNRFVTRYAYHHGYFDGEEREFRGFGMVEQRDTEEFAALTGDGTLSEATNIDAASHVPPVLTKTWFHTGAYLGRDHVSDYFAGLLDEEDAGEYYREPGLTDAQARQLLLADTVLPEGLSVEEAREACRSLKGAMLRQEVYALDDTAKREHPYTVTEQNFTIQRLQPRAENRHGVFFTHPREAISYHYERNPADPRIQHALTLEVDAYGNMLRSVAVGYPRANVSERQPEQNETHLTLTLNRFANRDDQPDWYRVGLPVESRTYEVVKPPTATQRFTPKELSDLVTALVPLNQDEPAAAMVIPYEQGDWRNQWNPQTDPGGVPTTRLRLIEHVRSLYRPNDMGAAQNDSLTLLPLGTLESLALSGESYKLAFTPALFAGVYGGRVSDAMLESEGRYVHSEGDANWWIPSGRVFFSPGSADTPAQELAHARQHFFLPHRYRDPFHTNAVSTESFVSYDRFDLLMVETRDPLDNRVTAATADDTGNIAIRIDYRVLQPYWVTDPNGNRAQVAFDALGMVVATAVMGKPDEKLGDLLEGFDADPPLADLQAFISNPQAQAAPLLGKATTRIIYDLDRYRRAGQPPVAATLARETHFHPAGAQTKIQISFSYSDGFGREIQKKIQAERGDAPQRGPTVTIPSGDVQPGALVRDANGKPVQADTPQRWVGNGRTVFNNKGKPVRQYEPFFSATHLYEPEREMTDTGVSPILFYDPVERVVATLHPNHTYEKVVFDPWHQTTYDVNDTINVPGNLGDPPFNSKNDPDVGHYFGRLPDDEYLPTWYDLRTDAAKALEAWPDIDAQGLPIPDNAKRRIAEKSAADKASVHTNTPTTAHLDTLGRPFLTVAINRFERKKLDNTTEIIQEPPYHTRVELDIEGNQRAVIDAKDRVVMRYDYDMLGNRIHQASMEAGERWMLGDVAGKPIRAWDSRGHDFVTAYDALRRPVEQYVRGTTAESDPRTLNRDLLVDKIEYGEGQANAETLNLRTRVYRHSDSAGVATSAALNPISNKLEAHDFKGNLLRSTRQLVSDYKAIPNWSLDPTLDNETFTSSTSYDALNRPVQAIAPRSDQPGAQRNVIQPVYNDANLLERVHVWLDHPSEPAGLLDAAAAPPSPVGVNNIDYDAKGQRERIAYKNGATTRYTYDPETFRLIHLYTRRGATFTEDCGDDPPPPRFAAPDLPPQGTPCGLQNLHYTYDPVGNITHIRDDAQQTIYFRNKRVEPSAEYTYDAIYRLIEATGREHLGQAGGQTNPPTPPDAFNSFHMRHDHPGDGNAMGTYTERYMYDAVGNFNEMKHIGSDPAFGWSRAYAYNEASLLEPGKQSNRLSSTTIDSKNPIPERYIHDAHGNMIRMPHLGDARPTPNMHWDYRDQLRQTDRGGGGTAYYVYDASGQRLRKVWEKSANLIEERIYLGGFEIFRRQGANALTRETLQIMDDKQRIALVETRTLDAAGNDRASRQLIRYQFGNHLGSASLELDDQAQIISYEEYYPYGSTSYQAVQSQTEASKRYRYTGKERDEESGLYYHGMRYYAPWLGRWTKSDPLYLKDATNVYIYALNNPIIAKDPTGGPAWLIPLAAYLGYKALSAAGETAVEAGIAKATGDEDFSVAGTYVKNTVVNWTIGLIPGVAESKFVVKAALYGGELTLRTTADATLDTAQGKGELTENLGKSLLGNVVGDAAAPLLKQVGSAIVKKFSGTVDDTVDDVVDAGTKKAISEGSDKVVKKVAARLSDDQLRKLPKEIAKLLKIWGNAKTIGVLQGELEVEVNGETVTKIVTLIASNNGNLTKALLALKKKGLLDDTYEIIPSAQALGISAKTGNYVKGMGPKGRQEMWEHAEQVLAVEAVERGLTKSRIATSINGCVEMCTPSFGPGGDLFPDITHLNPHGY